MTKSDFGKGKLYKYWMFLRHSIFLKLLILFIIIIFLTIISYSTAILVIQDFGQKMKNINLLIVIAMLSIELCFGFALLLIAIPTSRSVRAQFGTYEIRGFGHTLGKFHEPEPYQYMGDKNLIKLVRIIANRIFNGIMGLAVDREGNKTGERMLDTMGYLIHDGHELNFYSAQKLCRLENNFIYFRYSLYKNDIFVLDIEIPGIYILLEENTVKFYLTSFDDQHPLSKRDKRNILKCMNRFEARKYYIPIVTTSTPKFNENGLPEMYNQIGVSNNEENLMFIKSAMENPEREARW